MRETSLFLLGLALTAGSSLIVVWHLRSHLRAILVDLCGTQERADFWTAFSNVTLMLGPLVFALQFPSPEGNPLPALVQLTNQLRWSLAGLVLSVIVLGAILGRFIRRDAATAAGR